MILAFDFGGTKLTAGCLRNGETEWHDLKRVFSPDGADAQYEIETMIALGKALIDGQEIERIGISFGGPVDYESGIVRLSHHVTGWENIPLQQMFESEFGVPVRVDNDANVAALGEYQFGAGQGVADMMYLTVSTGVGGGWVLNGRSWRGHEGMAGEIGHMTVDPNGPLCLCGKRGCVERYASGPYMAADMEPEDGVTWTGKVVSEMAAQGHDGAMRRLMLGAWGWGRGVGSAANLIFPKGFVLGGGVTKSGEAWWTAVRKTAHQTAIPEVDFDIVPAQLGDDAPLWGAIALGETK